ncbi:MAG TPA: hypothetical protein VL882_03020 [Vicinamibacterales bacterium]|jgi:hypothetical protein|nr:hypothetical protein [Vicinamibacterales bacterium]
MRTTPYPVRPCDVVALTVPEFTCQLDSSDAVSIDIACQRFPEDINRAMVWFIRFRALTAWCARTETVSWLRSEPSRTGRACELAASFELNERWEFDADRFRSAVDSVAARRERAAHAR